MAGGMSVSMTIKIIDEASAGVKSLTGAMRELKAAGETVQGATGGRASDWNAERAAVQGVASEVRALGSLRQDTGAISAATSAYREEAAAIETARAGGERLVDMVNRQAAARRDAFRATQAAAADAAKTVEGPGEGVARFGQVGVAVGEVTIKLREEAAAVESLVGKMRELGEASRAAAMPIAPPGGPTFAGMGRAPTTEQPDLGAAAGRNRDWGAYWREKYGAPPDEHEPSATHPVEAEHPRTEAPPTATGGGGGGLISMVIGGAELGSGWKLVKGS